MCHMRKPKKGGLVFQSPDLGEAKKGMPAFLFLSFHLQISKKRLQVRSQPVMPNNSMLPFKAFSIPDFTK